MREAVGVNPETRHRLPVLWIVFFFQGMSVGSWLPALTNIFGGMGLGAWVPMAFMVPPLCALVGPLVGGALADQRYPANRLFIWSSWICCGLIALAFGGLQAGWHPVWFMVALGAHALVSGPTWGYLATISMTHLAKPEHEFPWVRMGATIGWIAGGLFTSYVLSADSSPVAGAAAVGARIVCAVLGLVLPHTPPLGVVRNWRSRIGLDAFELMRQRNHAAFFGVTALFSVPLSAFYMYGPEFLKVLGDGHPAGTMACAQVLEILSMMVLGRLLTKCSVKCVLLWALGLSVLRFGMSGFAGSTGVAMWHVSGLMLHGLCYTLYFITAQIFLDRRVDPGLRGQAQGLLTMVSTGLGPLLGAWLCGWMREHLVSAGGQGWDTFWYVLTAMIAVSFLLFAAWYRGSARPLMAEDQTPA